MPETSPLAGLQALLREVSDDLRAQLAADPSALDRLRSRRNAGSFSVEALAAENNSLDIRVQQSAGAWILGALIVRYLSDAGFTPTDLPADTHGEWLLNQFEQVATSVPGVRLFHPDEDPLFDIMVSEEAASRLHQLAAAGGTPVISGDPRGFGAVYQNVAGHLDPEHALIQTPSFVVERVLELVLESAIAATHAADVRVMDPVCGSGEFLVQAFHRLLRAVRSTQSSLTPAESVRLALGCVHGMDINPMAATIARFRLLLAAINASGETTLRGIVHHGWAIDVRVGDSLLDLDSDHSAYDVVVGNPPYVTPRDKKLDDLYRRRYSAAQGRYSLTVPFIQLFLGLARPADTETAGRVALLCSNSFTKRQFGKPLIENVLRHEATVTHVIDTAGAFIPGHGVPTLILVARRRVSRPSDQVFAVLGLHGEPRPPQDPAEGVVWRSIGRSLQSLGHHDRWTTSTMLHHDEVTSFPWAFAAGATASVLKRLSNARRLGSLTTRVGYHASIGAEEIFTAKRESFARDHTEPESIVPVVSGENVRDWSVSIERYAFLPHSSGSAETTPSIDGHLRRIWPYKTTLGKRATFSGRTYEQEGKAWYSWHQAPLPPDGPRIVYSAIGSTTHFALLPPGAVAMPSAPVIDGIEAIPPADLVAWLNTSTTSFWLQQHSPSKGQPNAEQTAGEGEPWEARYQFLPAQIRDIPLPPADLTEHASELARLADELSENCPERVIGNRSFDRVSLDAARSRWSDIRGRMIALSEELDWIAYAAFGLCDQSLLTAGALPPIRVGQRAFEIRLALDMTENGTSTRWFERHRATAHLQPVLDWPAEYRRVVSDRLRAIEQDPRLAVLEQPAHKRRWLSPSWDDMAWVAFTEWVIARCEQVMSEGSAPHRLWLAEELVPILVEDSRLVETAAMLGADRKVAEEVRKILLTNQVPVLAALRYRAKALPKWQAWQATWDLQEQEFRTAPDAAHRSPPEPPKYTAADFLHNSYWRNRGKYDMPREPFFSSPTPRGLGIGCSRWTASERVQAMVDALPSNTHHDKSDPSLLPLLAGIHEAMEQKRLPPTARQSFDKHLITSWEEKLGVSVDDLRAWLPDPPRRGRPRKHS
jgi:hypothetical protein